MGGGDISLRVRDLEKQFQAGGRTVRALRGVTLEIAAGEFVAIMGPSGCGKSTLLHLVAGLDKPDAGSIAIDGTEIGPLKDAALTLFRRRRIGLVFQAFNLISNLTARENILLPQILGGQNAPSADERCRALLTRLGLQDVAGQWPETLSGGEQQRVAIARALIGEPALILADEPTGSLDYANGQALCRLLHDLCKEEGRTILLVTHEPEVAAWAGRVLVMKDGALLGQLEHQPGADANRLAAAYHDLIARAPAAMEHPGCCAGCGQGGD